MQVVEALEETRTQLILVTEPIFASAADLLARFQTLPTAAAQARENTKLSELEIKAGLLQVIRPLHNVVLFATSLSHYISPAGGCLVL